MQQVLLSPQRSDKHIFFCRVLPLHDSAQIFAVKLASWMKQISQVREWYQNEHTNWVELDGQRSKWFMWNQALEIARSSVRQIQTYLQRIADGKSHFRL